MGSFSRMQMMKDKLIAKHAILRHVNGGLAIGPGWLPLLDRLCTSIKGLSTDINIVTIKEKFGRLRVYYDSRDADVDRIILEFEEESSKICYYCGNPARTALTFCIATKNAIACSNKYYLQCVKMDANTCS
jgi:hypothetical protein